MSPSKKFPRYLPLIFIIPALCTLIYSLAHAVDLSIKLEDVTVQKKLPTVSVPCQQVMRSLIKSYENTAPDKMFIKRYADILCRCGDMNQEHEYQVVELNQPCLQELGQCYSKLTPHVVKALDQCRQEGNSWEECKNLNFNEVIPTKDSGEFQSDYQEIAQACR